MSCFSCESTQQHEFFNNTLHFKILLNNTSELFTLKMRERRNRMSYFEEIKLLYSQDPQRWYSTRKRLGMNVGQHVAIQDAEIRNWKFSTSRNQLSRTLISQIGITENLQFNLAKAYSSSMCSNFLKSFISITLMLLRLKSLQHTNTEDILL